MAAYLIANVEITDPAKYDEYRKGVAPTLAAHGARFLARGGAAEKLEGGYSPRRVVIIEFPTMAALRTWYDSPEYVPLRALRMSASRGDMIVVDGV